MLITPPLKGQTYVSRTDPSLIVYVAEVETLEADKENEASFTVECCDPAYKDDVWNADGYEMTSDVWAKHDFSLVPE